MARSKARTRGAGNPAYRDRFKTVPDPWEREPRAKEKTTRQELGGKVRVEETKTLVWLRNGVKRRHQTAIKKGPVDTKKRSV